jgi:hypothetical protein
MIHIPYPERARIELSDPMLEHSWVPKALLGIVYSLDMKFVADVVQASLFLDLAEKRDFLHVRPLLSGTILKRT